MIVSPVSWHYLTVEETEKYIMRVPPYMKRELANSPLGYVYTGVLNLTAAFQDNNLPSPYSVEESLKMRPDVIISWDYLSENYEIVKIKGLIEITQDYGKKAELLRVIGEFTDKTERVKWLYSNYNGRIEKILDDIPEDAKPVSFIVIDNDTFGLWTNKNKKRFSEISQMVKGNNLAEQMTLQNGLLNIEAIHVYDPDLIFITPYTLFQTQITVNDIYTDERFMGLKAVRERKVYHMPKGWARMEGPEEEHLFIIWLNQILRPELRFNINLRNEIKDTFFDIYGYTMNDNQIDEWLRMDENIVSSDYSKFIH
jgi:ABC-type Fe3+-hydroxamate transport system substrate-binding protein